MFGQSLPTKLHLDLEIYHQLSKRKMASASGIINIDAFHADASATGQRTAEVTGDGSVENGASQETANSASYSTSLSSQENSQNQQRPSNNTFVGHATSSWGYDRANTKRYT